MRTSVVMLSVDEAHRLAVSLPAAVAQPGAEVLVVDNCSSDSTPAVVAAHGARYIRLAQRRSYCAAINAGIGASDSAAVLLLNADCVLDAGFLEAALPHLREPGIGSVAPKLIRARGMEESSRMGVIDTAGMVIDRRRKNALVGHNASRGTYATPGAAFGGDGAAVLYRREALAACAVGGEVLDEDFELWASDADLAWRAQLLGWGCVYEPGAIGWHVRHYSPSTRAHLDAADRRLQFRNRLLMIAKNETLDSLVRDFPRLVAYELLALGYVLLRERELLGAYRDALRLLGGARGRRAIIQARRAPDRRVPFGLRPPA